ncbi:MAG: selenium cofactor biosynthesis protein YqeC [Myxococcota bacterium]
MSRSSFENSGSLTAGVASRSWSTDSLAQALGLRDQGELVSIVGGGGKSAALFGLGASLPGQTLLTTTTRIFAAQTSRAARSCSYGSTECQVALRAGAGGLLVIGEIEGEKAKGVGREVPGLFLAAPGVDSVVVEADGSRMLPAKAPADHEPVLPDETTLLLVVAGIDALAGPIEETCHRPGRVSALVGLGRAEALGPADLSRLLCHPEGGLKGLPESSRAALLINKVETAQEWTAARIVAGEALQCAGVDRVVLGALEPEAPSGATGSLGRPVVQKLEVHERG